MPSPGESSSDAGHSAESEAPVADLPDAPAAEPLDPAEVVRQWLTSMELGEEDEDARNYIYLVTFSRVLAGNMRDLGCNFCIFLKEQYKKSRNF